MASLDAFIAASSAAADELCVSVQAAQSSITRGQTATYTVQVSTENGSASDVSVALTSQPSSQKPEFTSGCTQGDGTASCTVSSVTATQPANLNAQVAVASNATSVKLTATASVASTATWTPPAAAGITAVTAVAAAHSSAKASHSPAKASPVAPVAPLLPSFGPIPNLLNVPNLLNAEESLLISAGNASGLFPAITPPAPPSASQVDPPQAGGQNAQNAEPAAESSAVSSGTPELTAQVAGLIVLGLGIMLTLTRRSRRKRSGSRRTDS